MPGVLFTCYILLAKHQRRVDRFGVGCGGLVDEHIQKPNTSFIFPGRKAFLLTMIDRDTFVQVRRISSPPSTGSAATYRRVYLNPCGAIDQVPWVESETQQ